MSFLSILAALTVAFPRPGAKMPSVSQCYVIGATPAGTTNLVVQGRPVAVHPLGGWVTMVDCTSGVNVVTVETPAARTNVTFTVAAPPSALMAAAEKAVPRVYEKLSYAGDAPQKPPHGKKPGAITIVLDPGHGGSNDGALSPHGLEEKDANLRVAREVRRALEKKGYRVVLTRERDTFPKLYDRPLVAHAEKAAAFVSIHHNAPPFDKDPRGLRYHAVYAWNEIGAALGKSISRRMAAALEGDIPSHGVQHANFAVTRNPQIPSCLVEVDFITTPEGELACWNPARRRTVAAAIAAGIDDWCRGTDTEGEKK